MCLSYAWHVNTKRQISIDWGLTQPRQSTLAYFVRIEVYPCHICSHCHHNPKQKQPPPRRTRSDSKTIANPCVRRPLTNDLNYDSCTWWPTDRPVVGLLIDNLGKIVINDRLEKIFVGNSRENWGEREATSNRHTSGMSIAKYVPLILLMGHIITFTRWRLVALTPIYIYMNVYPPIRSFDSQLL